MNFLIFLESFIKAKTYSKPCQTFQRDFFAKIVNIWKQLTAIAKSSILDVWQHSVYVSEKHITDLNTVWRVFIFGVFLVRIFPHTDWIRTRKTPNTDTFHAVKVTVENMHFQSKDTNAVHICLDMCRRVEGDFSFRQMDWVSFIYKCQELWSWAWKRVNKTWMKNMKIRSKSEFF